MAQDINSIIARVVSVVGTASGIGVPKVHNGERDFTDEASVLYLMTDTGRRGGPMIHGWEVDSGDIVDTDPDGTSTNVVTEVQQVIVRGFYQRDDPQTGNYNTSKAAFRLLTHVVRHALIKDIQSSTPLTGTCMNATFPEIVLSDDREIAETPIHYVEMVFLVYIRNLIA